MLRSKLEAGCTAISHLTIGVNRLFDSLAKDKGPVPYDRDIADNRRKYGDTMLRKTQDHLSNQRQYEADNQARLDSARRKRQEDRDRQEALEVRLPSPFVF